MTQVAVDTHVEVEAVGKAQSMFSCLWQNKEYVCRGHDYERLEAFQQRMLSEFPQAVAMQHPNHPDDAILQCDAQCIFQCLVGEGGLGS